MAGEIDSWDGREVIGSRLAGAERQLRAMQAELHADLELTGFDEPVAELDRIVEELVGKLRSAAAELGIAAARRSARRSVAGNLALLWSDLVEVEPERLVRAWGAGDLPRRWRELHAELIRGVRSAQAAVDGRPVWEAP
jgi:hypothetical protein